MASQWLPYDDFLLRKSIEGGASLESLAKGAVKFSRKFTLSELTNRWRSLLYDPNVTSITSSIGFDVQYSTQLLQQNHHHTTEVVRSQYYATARKKMRVEEPPNYNNEFGNHNTNIAEPHVEVFGAATLQNLDFLDDLVEFDESQYEILRFSFPEIMQDQIHEHNNNGQIHDDTTQHVLLQEEFQDLHHFQQEETYHDAMLLSELDPHPEIKNGIIICILNKESDEIPDNCDYNPHQHNRRTRRNSINPSITSVSSLRNHMKPPLPRTKISSKGNESIQTYGFEDSVVATQESLKDSFSTEKTSSNVFAKTLTSLQHSSEIEMCQQVSNVEIDMKNPDNNNEIESDEDLPSFSDVEAMILDMDLEPVGLDQFALEVSRYQNQEAMRMIMRLEQSFESRMNRDIASHGAFAILYGSSKHYINKQEVLLGRATEDYPVDIDLGRSEKISRKQALINLKQDGCFEIKNLGKLPIWMNEKEIKQGVVVNLKDHCLIQIRENLSFIFEKNEKEVKRYLDGNHI